MLKLPLCYCVLKTDVFAHNLLIKEFVVLISLSIFFSPKRLLFRCNGDIDQWPWCDVIACISLSLSLSHLCLSIVQNSKSDGLHLLEFPMPMASLISLWFDHLFMWGRVSYLWCLLFVGRCTSEVGVSEILIPRLHSKEFVFYVC